MEQRAPTYAPASAWNGAGVPEGLGALGLAERQLDSRFAPVVVDTGGPFTIVGVREGPRPRRAARGSGRISEALDLVGFYVCTTDTQASEAGATARMFAPRLGIPEESATAGPLSALLRDPGGRPGPACAIEQAGSWRPQRAA